MRGDSVFSVYGLHEGRERDHFFGAYRSLDEARAQVEDLKAREMQDRNWARDYHNRGFAIRETKINTDFEVPLQPKPRDRYFVKATPKSNGVGRWDSTVVDVFRRNTEGGDHAHICAYERDYALLQTFEPFRLGDRDFALISRNYTKTAVLDLATGAVIVEEPEEGTTGSGFCPVGFYVPDWWDLHDGSVIPGSEHWSDDEEWPNGSFGFVWGCHWGDDSSWKVQYLDLSRIREGVIGREERFGYVELATNGYISPCMSPDPPDPARCSRPAFIKLSGFKGATIATFTVEMDFDLETGKPRDWQRLQIGNFE